MTCCITAGAVHTVAHVNDMAWLVQCTNYTAVPGNSAQTSGLLMLLGHCIDLMSCGGTAHGSLATQSTQLSSQPLYLPEPGCLLDQRMLLCPWGDRPGPSL